MTAVDLLERSGNKFLLPVVVIRREENMNIEPTTAYVYQPMPPQADGRFYGVGGLQLFGVDFDYRLQGITKSDAEKSRTNATKNLPRRLILLSGCSTG